MFNASLRPWSRPVTALFLVMAALAASGSALAQHAQTTPVLSAYFRMVFAGDIGGAPQLFDENPDDHGSKMLGGKFDSRFVTRTNGLDLSGLSSATVRTIIEQFQAYWRDTLMQTAPREDLEASLLSSLDAMLVQRGFVSALDDEDRLFENLEALVRDEGYFAKSGRTPPLLDLMVWASNETETLSIGLTDGVYTVDINYVDGFIVGGWSHFAAFGMARTGGWAQTDGLYCPCADYDLDSERFELSFLKHEARHYADFGLYPELQPADLEYRSKLTELAFSNEQTHSLAKFFTDGANRIADAPHPLANWYVADGLARHLLDGEPPADSSAWHAIPAERIRQVARQLLDEHSTALASLGAKTAKGVINL